MESEEPIIAEAFFNTHWNLGKTINEIMVLFAKYHREQFQCKAISEIKEYVKSLDKPDNIIYKENELLINSCFSKSMEFIENTYIENLIQ
jgi:predicted protein tyrosine phosphatase